MKVHPAKSVFIKLIAAYGVIFLLMISGAIIIRFLSVSSPNMEISVKNARDYVKYLVEEIGNPPDPEVAQKISRRTNLQIIITGPDLKWSSNGELWDDEMTLAFGDEDDIPHFLPQMRDFIIPITEGEYSYYFTEFHSDFLLSASVWLVMIGSILLALIISYLIVRHLLKPLREMNKVALEFGVSDWKKRVNPQGADEFATLGRTMDSMADRIEMYILSMHDLLVAISHELRSPLTRMKVALEFIDNNRIRESLNEEINTLDRLTGNLLEQRRLATGSGILKKEQVALHQWIETLCRPYTLEKIPLEIQKKGPDKSVLIDCNQMAMAMRNLIENSLRHAPGSPIVITVDTLKSEEGFYLEVSDKGPGMTESLISRTGEPFLLGDPSRAGKRTDGGFGLGLSIVKAVTDAHGAVFSARNLKPAGFAVKLDF